MKKGTILLGIGVVIAAIAGYLLLKKEEKILSFDLTWIPELVVQGDTLQINPVVLLNGEPLEENIIDTLDLEIVKPDMTTELWHINDFIWAEHGIYVLNHPGFDQLGIQTLNFSVTLNGSHGEGIAYIDVIEPE